MRDIVANAAEWTSSITWKPTQRPEDWQQVGLAYLLSGMPDRAEAAFTRSRMMYDAQRNSSRLEVTWRQGLPDGSSDMTPLRSVVVPGVRRSSLLLWKQYLRYAAAVFKGWFHTSCHANGLSLQHFAYQGYWAGSRAGIRLAREAPRPTERTSTP